MATAEMLLTVEEFSKLPPDGRLCELVAGRIVEMNSPAPRHGFICANITFYLTQFVMANRLGRVACNDSGVITRRSPDSVRGPDVAYFSFSRVPASTKGTPYFEVAPDLVCEVLSEHDRRTKVTAKAMEYLEAGVIAVCVFDPDHETVTVFRDNREPEVFNSADTLTLRDVLPGFSPSVAEFFAL